MPSYTSEQKRNVQKLKRVARMRGASPRETKALLEAAAVESNFRHVNYGDRDSVGILQQRPSQGWGPKGEGVERDAEQFLSAARRLNRAGYKGSAGRLAADVQRPDERFRGRYDERAGEVEGLLGSAPRRPSARAPASSSGAQATYRPGVDNSTARRDLKLQYLESRGQPGGLLALRAGLEAAQDTPGQMVYDSAPKGSKAKPKGKTSNAKVRELFWNGPGAINIDEGKRVGEGYVSGHTDHAHLAMDDPDALVRAAELAQEMGLAVREFSPYDAVDPVHTKGSFHYQKTKNRKVNKAMDVSGKRTAEWARRIASGRY